jgi:3-isopropylmalate/(R)-2-methylmalate dehydratase small subunit
MNQIITGSTFVLGNNIDTDQIIPAEHLVYSLSDPEEAKKYGRYALSGVPPAESGLPQGHLSFIEGAADQSRYSIIVGGSNFGCGSSREHAPFALQKAGIKSIIAESYARIFYRNAVDGGFVIPLEAKEKIHNKIKTGDEVTIDFKNHAVTNLTTGEIYHLRPLGDVLPIIDAGGLFAYARLNGMIRE